MQDAYANWLDEIRASNPQYAPLFPGAPYPPIFFFGNPEGAIAATVGVNPSAGEFAPQRRWRREPMELSHLLERCRNYFTRPAGVPRHPWFETWERFLQNVGLSYTTPPRAVHLDLSPRATRSISSLQKESEQLIDLFSALVKEDLRYFVDQLRGYPSIKYLYLAGAVTKKYYCIEFLSENTSVHGCHLKSVLPFRRGGSGQVGLYMLDVGDQHPRFLFFCSTSPSARTEPHPLPQRAHWLKTHYPRFTPTS